MKHYFKIFLLTLIITGFNLLMYLVLQQIQINRNGGYIPQEFIEIFLILMGIPLQFVLLAVISLIFKKNKIAILITSGLFVVVCFLILWLTSIDERRSYNEDAKEKQLYSKTEQKHYGTDISTPEGYPVKLLRDGGRLSVIIDGKGYSAGYFKTGEVYSESWGSGWGEGGGVSIPDSLKLFWFSFLENKYYRLNAKLDKAKISEYFKRGFKREEWDDRIHSSQINRTEYENLVAGIAPGGDVVLWISGRNDTREIGVYKGKEMNPNQSKDYDIVEEKEIKRVLSDTCTCKNDPQFRKIIHNNKPIAFGIWTKKYRERYHWKVEINPLGETKSELKFNFFNGENFSLYNEEVVKMTYQKLVLPSYVNFSFTKNKKEYNAYFEFDEDEIFNNFKKLTEQNPNEAIDFIFNINPDSKNATVKLRSKSKTLDFQKMKTMEVN